MSRSECFDLLQQKRVWRCHDRNNPNSKRLSAIDGPAVKIGMKTELFIDRTHRVPLPPPLLAVYHKPKWVLSVVRDPLGRPCLDAILANGSRQHPVGRLDYDSQGLLLLSSDGALTQYLLHPRHNVEKEYLAVVTGLADPDSLRQQFIEGVATKEGIHNAELLSVEHWDKDQVACYLKRIKSESPQSHNQTDESDKAKDDMFAVNDLSSIRLVVKEGKHRMVRRMLYNCGHPVVDLKRERVGLITLGDLPVGDMRDLSIKEMEWAKKLSRESATLKKPKKPYVKKKIRGDDHYTSRRFNSIRNPTEQNKKV